MYQWILHFWTVTYPGSLIKFWSLSRMDHSENLKIIIIFFNLYGSTILYMLDSFANQTFGFILLSTWN